MRAGLLRSVLIVLCASLFCGCKDKAKEQRRAELIALMHGNTADPDIAAAMEKARSSVPKFLAALQKPAPNQKQFLVRKVFPSAGGKQQILWVNHITYDGTLLHGQVDDNTVQPGSGIPRDGKISFPPTEIADWMFNEDGKAVGGFMLRVLKMKMTDKEWSDLTRQITFKEEDQ